MFIDSLFNSIENVKEIKEKYKEKVEVWLVEKDISNKTRKVEFNIAGFKLLTQFFGRQLVRKIFLRGCKILEFFWDEN